MKKILFIFISFFVFFPSIYALDLELNSKYVYVYNLTEDKVMYEKESKEEVLVASMTKIMTAIIVIENNPDLEKEIIIKDEDLRDMYEYTTTGFQDGDKVTIREVLYGILLKSGSDAVNAGVRITTDTEEEFINLMNQKVKELGLVHTHFSNAVGKDQDNYSSAEDIAMIMKYCLKNKDFKEIISTDMYYVETLDLQINGPLYKSLEKYDIDTSIVGGGKTGFTTLAKHSMVSYAEKDDITYIVVTDYAENYKNLLNDTNIIYNYFFDNYGYVDYDINFDLDIENGKEEKYNVKLKTKLYLDNTYDESLIDYKYNGTKTINFLKSKGSKLGTVSIYYDNELIKEIDVKLNKNIEYETKAYSKLIIIIAIIMVCVISLFILLKLRKKINKLIKRKHNKKIKPIQTIKIKENINKTVKQDIKPKVEKVIKEENSEVKKLNILKKTTNISLFFETLKKSSYTTKDKQQFEHDLIDRCFEKIDFKNLDELKDLYTKLKLYKKDMDEKTIKYFNKLFKYCIDKYIDKK
ncbi:MAG: D-alanyl-D-alanine carboxypeptidase [Bacilli bacterium]|nr:D-alanyl-D-alanine carboxypeptidase [Bacilli bacterium]